MRLRSIKVHRSTTKMSADEEGKFRSALRDLVVAIAKQELARAATQADLPLTGQNDPVTKRIDPDV